MPLNVLLLTVDDMNYNSVGAFGCGLQGVTPNIDRLAGQGLVLENAHVAIAVCQPSRSVLMTGRYPHRNGARGFEAIAPDVTTLTEVLHHAGYCNGIIGKEDHLAPREKFYWDTYVRTYNPENSYGRDPARYYQHTKAFLQSAGEEQRPFFLMVNCHDPHRPFAGSDDELDFFGAHMPVPQGEYRPEEVAVPGFLPDIPDVRREIAQYYTSVRRADSAVGETLRALAESGAEDDTLVLFLSDNGMAFPFAKTNCYQSSTKSPWIFKWPGRISPGTKSAALVSGIDYMPTVLDGLGLPPVPGMDGTSLLPVLAGRVEEHHDYIFTQFFKTAANPVTKAERHYPMRCVQDKRFAYIYNPWSDGQTTFLNESMTGLTFAAMERAAGQEPAIARRVAFCRHRVREELYDCQNDPDALENLAGKVEYRDLLASMRQKMAGFLQSTGDEAFQAFSEEPI